MVNKKIDEHVGRQIWRRRTLLGLGAKELAEPLGVSVPQIYKYEAGLGRILVHHLYKMAQTLGVPISYFFENFENGAASPEQAKPKGTKKWKGERRALQFAGIFLRLPPKQRAELVKFTETLSSDDADSG